MEFSIVASIPALSLPCRVLWGHHFPHRSLHNRHFKTNICPKHWQGLEARATRAFGKGGFRGSLPLLMFSPVPQRLAVRTMGSAKPNVYYLVFLWSLAEEKIKL